MKTCETETRELGTMLSTYAIYGSTSERLVNTYSMIRRHSSWFKVLYLASLALKLSSEDAETRFIIASIITRGWIMHAGKIVTIVFGCEV